MTVTEAPPATADSAAHPQPQQTTVGAEGGSTDVVVALAQIAPRLGDVPANLDRHLELIAAAAVDGAALVVFPELSLTGYFLHDLVPDVALREDSDEVLRLAAACQEVDALVGCVLESPDARFHNVALYLSGGRVHHVHRKVYLPTYGLFDEARYLAQGDRFRAFAAPLPAADPPRPWSTGVLVCEDMWHPTAISLLARQGVELILGPSASPGRGVVQGHALGSERSYDAITRTHAQLSTTYLLYCNRVGFEDGIAFWGGSRAVGPDGRLLDDPAGADESTVLHRLDLAAVRRARIANPLLRDERDDISDAETDRLRARRALD